ncbi:hypothetical protein [Nocardiopsis sp. FIRDI 009]|uniref:hypothetical protein n=1 Tax=Nocardiopsis sp. FIRDI 009 TaxID=714197 RepID=UPI000E22D8C8|nr:hypothetical protein [Nocardiopsis sp. FIRDI 009]
MALFPIGVWKAARALTLSGAIPWVLLLAPVIVGAILLMLWLSARWLEGTGIDHPTSIAALVTGTAMATPVVVAYLAPAATPLPGGLTVNIVFLTGMISTAAVGACLLVERLPSPRPPGPLAAVAVVASALVALPLVSDLVRVWAGVERAREQISGFDHTIGVLDHPDWAPARVHEINDGLRITYRNEEGATVHVLSWGGSEVLDPHGEGVRAGCDFPGVRCRKTDGTVLVDRGPGTPNELRVRFDEGAVVSVISEPDGAPADLVDLAPAVRPEEAGERDRLAESVTDRALPRPVSRPLS